MLLVSFMFQPPSDNTHRLIAFRIEHFDIFHNCFWHYCLSPSQSESHRLRDIQVHCWVLATLMILRQHKLLSLALGSELRIHVFVFPMHAMCMWIFRMRKHEWIYSWGPLLRLSSRALKSRSMRPSLPPPPLLQTRTPPSPCGQWGGAGLVVLWRHQTDMAVL